MISFPLLLVLELRPHFLMLIFLFLFFAFDIVFMRKLNVRVDVLLMLGFLFIEVLEVIDYFVDFVLAAVLM